MIGVGGAAGAQSLIGALRDLDGAYHAAIGRADDVIAALAAGDFEQVQIAVMAQDAVLRTIVDLEGRRHAIQVELESRVDAGHLLSQPGDPDPTFIRSRLLELLPPDEAEPLRAARHDLLLTMRDLQSRNGVATLMLQNAQTVMKRLFRAQAPTMISYGPDGEPVLVGQPVCLRRA